MPRQRTTKSRGELSSCTDQDVQRLADQEQKLERVCADNEEVHRLLDSLELAGTSEAVESVEHSVERAEAVTVEVFEREDHTLEQHQQETDTHAGELKERSDASNTDLGRVADTRGRVETQEAHGDLTEAESALQDDLRILGDLLTRNRQARESSEHEQEIANQKLHRRS